jgi:hypothetical protein
MTLKLVFEIKYSFVSICWSRMPEKECKVSTQLTAQGPRSSATNVVKKTGCQQFVLSSLFAVACN